MKAKKLLAILLAFIMILSNMGTASVQAEESQTQESRIENLREEEWSWIYTDEEATLSVNTEGLDDITEIRWHLSVWNEETDETTMFEDMEGIDFSKLYSVSEDNHSITLKGAGLDEVRSVLREGKWFDVGVDVSYGDDETFSQGFAVELRTPAYNYDFPLIYPGENQMLVCENRWINSFMHVWYEDQENPYGMEQYVAITDVKIAAQYSWDEEGNEVEIPMEERTIVRLEGNADEGWGLFGEDHGFAVVEMAYETVDGDTATYEFNMYSIGEYYRMEKLYPNDNHNMLLESENRVGVRVIRVYLDEWENYCEEEMVDYTVDFLRDDAGEPFYDKDLATITIEENEFVVEANSEHGYMEPWICAKGEIDGNEWSAETIMEINITDQFENIEPIEFTDEDGNRMNTMLGDTLDIMSLENKPVIYHYEVGKEKTLLTENVRLRLEYNEDVWQPTEETEEELVPVLERINHQGGEIRLVAERNDKNGWYEIARRQYWFDSIDYSVGFEELYGGDWGRAYEEGDSTHLLNTDNLSELKDYNIEVSLGVSDEEGFRPFESEEELFDTVVENGKVTGVILRGSKLKEIKELMNEGNWFEVQIYVKYGDLILSESNTGFELVEKYVSYDYQFDRVRLLPGWSKDITKILYYYEESAEHPIGYSGEVIIEDISVRSVDGMKDVVRIEEWDNGEAWEITAEKFGFTQIVLTHAVSEESDETATFVIDVEVSDVVWDYDLTVENDIWEYLPGSETNASIIVNKYMYSPKDGYSNEEPEDIEVVWEYIEEEGNEIATITPDKKDQRNLNIKFNEDAEDASWVGVSVHVYPLDKNGNRIKDGEGNDLSVIEDELWFVVLHEIIRLDYTIDFSDVADGLTVGDNLVIKTTVTNPFDYDFEHVYAGVGCADYPSEWVEILATENERYEVTENGAYFEVLKAGETVEIIYEKTVPEAWAGHEIEFGGGVYIMSEKEMIWDNVLYEATECATSPEVAQKAISNPFNDVNTQDYYYNPVLWAVANGITSGTSATTFEPGNSCTRGQVVAFLWRAAGCPEPKAAACNFVDVQNGTYYMKAVLWAVENGVTSGTSATTFEPDATCTRGQIATFLWRAAGKPASNSSVCNFKDVVAGAYYYDAVLWAVENGITSGTSATTFEPESVCTRGQIVTFLYRHYE